MIHKHTQFDTPNYSEKQSLFNGIYFLSQNEKAKKFSSYRMFECWISDTISRVRTKITVDKLKLTIRLLLYRKFHIDITRGSRANGIPMFLKMLFRWLTDMNDVPSCTLKSQGVIIGKWFSVSLDQAIQHTYRHVISKCSKWNSL